jgi:hypothetical protein
MDIPGQGVVQGQWDLRAHVDSYLGGVDLQGKEVLEIGAASGFLTVEMEKRGASVIAYDLSDEFDWDNVPFARLGDGLASQRKAIIRQLNNGWWLVHQAYQSSARMVHGTVYNLPEGVGSVDVATFGCVLLHLRDPFQALAAATRHVRESVIITEHDLQWDRYHIPPHTPAPPGPFCRRLLAVVHWLLGDAGWRRREETLRSLQSFARAPLALFLPNDRDGGPVDTWWAFRPPILCEMLAVLGFPSTMVTFSEGALYNGKPQKLFTVVGRRR